MKEGEMIRQLQKGDVATFSIVYKFSSPCATVPACSSHQNAREGGREGGRHQILGSSKYKDSLQSSLK